MHDKVPSLFFFANVFLLVIRLGLGGYMSRSSLKISVEALKIIFFLLPFFNFCLLYSLFRRKKGGWVGIINRIGKRGRFCYCNVGIFLYVIGFSG
ncbi:hypothetical protein OIU74_003192 [Salix koriyanagi]|uniref:Uncharacterized protein n=1 Tax=Salix koriyanagi TaxID=2511006 RepID=A0A9Q0UXF2_9ROSI|nr:hypothetical protein OIU74_003192 [Salix koriyanagi]